MIDIFVEELEDNNLTVYFVQLGCIYEADYNSLSILCENVVSLYVESNKKDIGDVNFSFLPINLYHRLYSKNSKFLFKKSLEENIEYTVNKIC